MFVVVVSCPHPTPPLSLSHRDALRGVPALPVHVLQVFFGLCLGGRPLGGALGRVLLLIGLLALLDLARI